MNLYHELSQMGIAIKICDGIIAKIRNYVVRYGTCPFEFIQTQAEMFYNGELVIGFDMEGFKTKFINYSNGDSLKMTEKGYYYSEIADIDFLLDILFIMMEYATYLNYEICSEYKMEVERYNFDDFDNELYEELERNIALDLQYKYYDIESYWEEIIKASNKKALEKKRRRSK